jgi:hypothetical protein
VTIGSTNDKTVVIRGGLSEGEEVVLNAVAYREKVALPEVQTERRSAALAAAGAASQKQKTDGSPADKLAINDEPAVLTASMFQQYDRDNDGKVRLADLPEKLRLRLQAADVNKDGLIDRAEWTAAGRPVSDSGGTSNSPPKAAVSVDVNSR